MRRFANMGLAAEGAAADLRHPWTVATPAKPRGTAEMPADCKTVVMDMTPGDYWRNRGISERHLGLATMVLSSWRR